VLDEGAAKNAHGWFGSRSQLLDCLEHRLIELIQSSPFQPQVEGGTDVGATKPELNVIAFVDHRILEHVNPGLLSQNRKKRTLIIVRRVLTELNAVFACVIGQISLAKFRVSIATFNEESVLSRPFGR